MFFFGIFWRTAKDLANLWMKQRHSKAWQTLFMAMGLQEELPPSAHEAASAAAEARASVAAEVSASAAAGGSSSPPRDGVDEQPLLATPPRKSLIEHRGGQELLSPVKSTIRPRRIQQSRPALFGVGKAPDQVLRTKRSHAQLVRMVKPEVKPEPEKPLPLPA